MKFNKKIMLLGLAGAATLGLASCGEQAVTGTYDLKVWAPEAALELTETQIKEFEAQNDGLTLNLTIEKVGEGDAATSMITDVENGADIYFFAQDQLTRLVEARALAKVGSSVQTWISENNDAASVSASSTQGSTYCYPLTSDNGYFMYYDKSVITNAAHLDSLEDLIADCEAANRLFSFQLEGSGWYNASFFFAAGATSVWSQDSDGKWSATDNYDSDAGVIAVKGMQKLLKSTCYNNTSGAPDAFAKEGAQKSAIVVSGTWDAATTQEVLGANYAATDLPSFTVDGKSYELGSFVGCKLLGTKPQTDVNKAYMVQRLAQYLTGEDCQKKRFEELQWGPSNVNAQKMDAVKENVALSALALQKSHKSVYVQGQYPGQWWDISKAIATAAKTASTDEEIKSALKIYSTAVTTICSTTTKPVAERAYSVIGGMNDDGWETDIAMTKASDSLTWTSSAITFAEGDEFKVRADANWDTSYGADNGSSNVVVKVTGSYKVVFTILTQDADGEPTTWSIELVAA